MAAKSKSKKSQSAAGKVDFEKFRLRNFVDRLIELDEVEIHDEPVDLSDLSRIIEATDKATLFRKAGPEQVEMVSSVAGSRSRIAAAFGVAPDDLAAEFQSRLDNPQPVIEIERGAAPAQQVVMTGDDIDLAKLPFHPQHKLDGGTYISSAIDYSIDPESGLTNVGCRRLSLRSRNQLGTNVTAPSDLRQIYLGCVERGEILAINFAVGSHPLDFMAAGMRVPADEVTLVGTLRGAPVPLVKGMTNEVPVPADAEMVIEGYLDERGYIEPEGPFGEYMGYYGPMHMDPVFQVTAVTMREDVLHQTVLHGAGQVLHQVESVNMVAINLEARIRKLLAGIGVDVAQVRVMLSSGEAQVVRIAIRQELPGKARNAIAAVFGALLMVKHVFIVDDDIDVFDENQFEWAFATRFQADKDIVIQTGLAGMRMDPSLEGAPTGAKAGFDLTFPVGRRGLFLNQATEPPRIEGAARHQTVEQALESGAKFFVDLMAALGSRDGREIALALDDLHGAGKLTRLEDGQYKLRPDREKGSQDA